MSRHDPTQKHPDVRMTEMYDEMTSLRAQLAEAEAKLAAQDALLVELQRALDWAQTYLPGPSLRISNLLSSTALTEASARLEARIEAARREAADMLTTWIRETPSLNSRHTELLHELAERIRAGEKK